MPRTKEQLQKKRFSVLTSQQELFLSRYTDPKSDTFGNAYRSALAAGYGDGYARTITTRGNDWLFENVADMRMLKKAERNLNDVLDLNTETITLLKTGSRKYKKVKTHDSSLLKIKNDTSQFIAERLGKSKYSTRSEVTGKDGAPLINDEIKKKIKGVINEFIGEDTGEGTA